MLAAAPAADGLSQRRRSDARRIRDDTGGPPFASAVGDVRRSHHVPSSASAYWVPLCGG